ncbi:hypothetical protein CORC01_11597 [Colletotrichum orchidophilum]|uniref:Uncharacterized protein n=1 Tax=Colletotrichum orchidophilum TaxID=1209926 RepID=A0A1G4AVC0_9PEZI|nr:uncharacterized protein CORC01_11597 [Colletotrichum orchidophilum]OHE93108.1 hypothetical protein CORC01_11597 [Colletotrichum orchidophilum]
MQVHLEQAAPSRPDRRDSDTTCSVYTLAPKTLLLLLLHEDRARQPNTLGLRWLLGRLVRGRSYQGLWRFTMRLRDPCGGDRTTDVDFEWRHSRGLTVRTLRRSDGWMLWRKRTPDEARLLPQPYRARRAHANGEEELVAMLSIDPSRPHLGIGFQFLNAAAGAGAENHEAQPPPFLDDDFALVAVMSGIGIIMGSHATLGGAMSAEEIQAAQRPHLKRAAFAERHAREAKEWLATLDLLDDGDRDDEPPSLRRAERGASWGDLHGSRARGPRERGAGDVAAKVSSADRRRRSLSAPEISSRRRSSRQTPRPESKPRQIWEKRPAVYMPTLRERTANTSASGPTRRTAPLRSLQRSSYGDRDPTSRAAILSQGGSIIE